MATKEMGEKKYLSIVLDVEDNALVNEYASLRKTGRSTAIRQFLHDTLPAQIQQLQASCQEQNQKKEKGAA